MNDMIHDAPEATTTRTGHPTRSTPIPPVTCEPWCYDGNGHTDATSMADQLCFTDEIRVPLTREKLVQMIDDSWALDFMQVYAAREAEGRAHAVLSHGDLNGVELTPQEARQLGEALVRFSDMIENQAPRPD